MLVDDTVSTKSRSSLVDKHGNGINCGTQRSQGWMSSGNSPNPRADANFQPSSQGQLRKDAYCGSDLHFVAQSGLAIASKRRVHTQVKLLFKFYFYGKAITIVLFQFGFLVRLKLASFCKKNFIDFEIDYLTSLLSSEIKTLLVISEDCRYWLLGSSSVYFCKYHHDFEFLTNSLSIPINGYTDMLFFDGILTKVMFYLFIFPLLQRERPHCYLPPCCILCTCTGDAENCNFSIMILLSSCGINFFF